MPDGRVVGLMRRLVRGAGRAYARSPLFPERGKGRVTAALGRLDHGGRELVESEFLPGLRAALDMGSHVERQIYYDGFYRPWLLAPFRQLLGPGSVVADVGANVGAYSMVASQVVGPPGVVLALEPDPSPYEKLVRNLQMSGLKNVVPLRLAAGEQDGTARLHMNPSGHSNEAQASLTAMEMHGRTETIEVRTLDSILAARSLDRLDVMKMDAQGGELGVLRGGARAIEASRPAIMLRCHEEKCRAFGNGTIQLQGWLLDRGYRIRLLDYGRRPVRGARPPDLWLERKDQLSELENATFLALHPSRPSR